MRGTLALVGSGEYLPSMEPVDRKLLDRVCGQPHVVCLPTAAGTEGPERIHYWSRLGVEHFTRLGADVQAVEVIDRETAQDESFASQIRSANFVYLSGGRPEYLYQTLVDSRAWSAILEVLEAGGVVAGCSAGAMIFGERVPTFPTLLPWRRTFNLLPGTIIVPHFDEMPGAYARLIESMTLGQSTLLGIDGNTALVQSESGFEVSGAGGVTVWNRHSKRRFRDGEAVIWS